MQLNKLSLKIFYPDIVPDHETEDFNAVFALWHKVWIETRLEVGLSAETPIDDFTRQTEVLALFYENRPVATISHRFVDFAQPAVMHDSYFSPTIWPDWLLKKIPHFGRYGVLGSQIFIDPDFRKRASGLPTKQIICNLCFAHLNLAKPEVLLGRMRKDRGLHELLYRSGGLSLHVDTSWREVPLDLVAFFPSKNPIALNPDFRDVVARMGEECDKFGQNIYFMKLKLGGKNERTTQVAYRPAS